VVNSGIKLAEDLKTEVFRFRHFESSTVEQIPGNIDKLVSNGRHRLDLPVTHNLTPSVKG